jgi:hypothetical protein
MSRKLKAPSPAMVVALIALFVALGGTSYAAMNSLPPNSVGTAQLKPNAVASAKIAAGAVTPRTLSAAALAPEPWHEVGTPGQPAFQNGCTNAASTTQHVAYYKDREGVVHLKGLYDSCTASGSQAFQLPGGYRPEGGKVPAYFPLTGGDPGKAVAIRGATGSRANDGGVSCGAGVCFLSGITFRAES